MQRNPANARQPFSNVERKPCFVCGATESKRWKFHVEDGVRAWICTGVYDTAHRNARTGKTIRDWTVDLQKRDAERARVRLSVQSPTEEGSAAVPRARTPRKGVRALDDRASRSRTPRVSGASPGASRCVAVRAELVSSRTRGAARRFILDEAEEDERGDEDEDEDEDGQAGTADDGFIVPDHDSDDDDEAEHDGCADDVVAEEHERDDGEGDDVTPLRRPPPRVVRTLVVSDNEDDDGDVNEAGAGAAEAPHRSPIAGAQDADSVESPWPPCHLPLRLRESPAGVVRRALDFGITCTPQAHRPTERVPNPVEPTDDVRLACAYRVMRKAARLFRSLHKRGMLIEAAGGMERGDKNGHPHAQIAGSAWSARTVEYWTQFMRLLFKMCCTEEDDIVHYYISVVLRKKQSQEYAIGYCMKQREQEWQQNRPADEGYFMIGATENPERADECWNRYSAYAGDIANEIAYGKLGGGSRGGGTGGYNARRGGTKPIDINKTNFFNVAHLAMSHAKMSDAITRTTTVKQVALVLEGGKHQLTPSWGVARGAGKIDEAQIATIDYVNANPYLAADVSLVRHAMFGYWERPSDLHLAPVFWKPRVLASVDTIESLNWNEAKAYSDSLTLPPHASLRAQYPYVEGTCVRGYVLIVDLMYSFAGSTSAHVGAALAERGFSITPNIYNDLGEMGLDATGKYACAHIALAQIEFGQRPMDQIGRYLSHAVRSIEYDAWVERTLSQVSADDDSISILLEAQQCYKFLFHGVMRADAFLESFQAFSDTRAEDGATHSVIISTEEMLEDTSPRRAYMHTEGSDDVAAVHPHLSAAPMASGLMVDITDLEAMILEDAPEIAEHTTHVDGTPLPDKLPRGNEDGIARMHHYAVCWRMGFHPTQGDYHRSLDDCVPSASHTPARYTPSSVRFPRAGGRARWSPNSRRPPRRRSPSYSPSNEGMDELDK